ncbi:MAG TPA: ParB/RepB/Spo0J family partition protein [Nevskia sp.]|nr:ParB/RepB/Spo0J family partition protein [Nevskia sp.]
MSADGSAEEYRDLPLGDIAPDPRQPRRAFVAEAINELADSIAQHGVLQPILVRPVMQDEAKASTLKLPPWLIIAGERRWRAAQQAGLKVIPARIRRGLSMEQIRYAQLIENLQREDLNLAETSEALATLIEIVSKELEKNPDPEGRSALEVVGSRLGKKRSKSWVSERANILSAPDPIKKLVVKEKVRDVHAITMLAQLHQLKPEAAERLAERYEKPTEWQGSPTRTDVERELRWARDEVKRKEEERKAREAAAKDPKAIADQEKQKKAAAAERKRKERIAAINKAIEQHSDQLVPAFNAALGFKQPKKAGNRWPYDLPVLVKGESFQSWETRRLPADVNEAEFSLELNPDDVAPELIQKVFAALPKSMKPQIRVGDLYDFDVTLEQMEALKKVFGDKINFEVEVGGTGASLSNLLQKLQGKSAAVSHGKQQPSLVEGMQVRVKDEARGRGGHFRKCAGKVGTLETIGKVGCTVRFKPGRDGIVTGLGIDEIEPAEAAAGSAPATEASPASEVGDFLKACTQAKKGGQVKGADLYAAYEAYCKRHKLQALTLNDNRYGDAIAAAGVKKKRFTEGYRYLDMQLLVEGE